MPHLLVYIVQKFSFQKTVTPDFQLFRSKLLGSLLTSLFHTSHSIYLQFLLALTLMYIQSLTSYHVHCYHSDLLLALIIVVIF